MILTKPQDVQCIGHISAVNWRKIYIFYNNIGYSTLLAIALLHAIAMMQLSLLQSAIRKHVFRKQNVSFRRKRNVKFCFSFLLWRIYVFIDNKYKKLWRKVSGKISSAGARDLKFRHHKMLYCTLKQEQKWIFLHFSPSRSPKLHILQ